MSWLIVGLGNYGKQYEKTRHNIGFRVVENLDFSLTWKEKFKGLLAIETQKSEQIIFLKPMTYMNLSGESVQPCAHFFKIPPAQIVVVYDEIDLPFGMMKMKTGGGLAGHNGLKSIAEKLGTNDFKRLRMGIDRPVQGSVSNYVLSAFSGAEEESLENFLEVGRKAVVAIINKGFEKAANEFSRNRIME